MHVDIQVRLGHTHARTFAVLLVETVNDRVFHFVRHVPRVFECLRINSRIDAECRCQIHILLPVDLFDLGIHAVRIIRAERGYRHQHARGGSQPQVSAVQHALVARERHRTTTGLDIISAYRGNLSGQHFLQTLEGLRYHRKLCSHYGIVSKKTLQRYTFFRKYAKKSANKFAFAKIILYLCTPFWQNAPTWGPRNINRGPRKLSLDRFWRERRHASPLCRRAASDATALPTAKERWQSGLLRRS